MSTVANDSDLKVWYTRCPAPTPLSIAYQLGWVPERFAALGIAVDSIRDSRDPKVRNSHFDHTLSWSFRQGGNIPPIWARASGRDTRVVGLTVTDEFQALIALPESGIDGPGGLKGRRIGVPRQPTASIDFQRATALKGIVSGLSLGGLDENDVELVHLDNPEPALLPRDHAAFLGLGRRLPYGDEVRALLRGEIDAFFVKGAEGIATANLIGAAIVTEFGFHPDAKIRINNGTPRPLTVDATFLAERPDLVEQLVATVAEAGDWAAAHPDETLRFVAREIGASEDAVRAANGPELAQHLRLDLAEEQIAALDHFQHFLHRFGFIAATFDVRNWIAPGPLSAVRRKVAA